MPNIGDRHPNQDAIDASALNALAAKYAKPERGLKRRVARYLGDLDAKPQRSNNGFYRSTSGTTDWDKQDKIAVGRPNPQWDGQQRGTTVSGAGKRK